VLASRLELVEIATDPKGRPITSGVLVPTEAKAAPEQKTTRRQTNAAVIAERAMREAVANLGTIPPASNYIPPHTKAVTEARFRQYAYERGISTGCDRAKERAFARGVERLIADRIVGVWQGLYWLIKE
jgi:hypothetical protein